MTFSSCSNKGYNNLATSGNDPNVSKSVRYGQYVKTARTYNVPVKKFFDISNGHVTKNQTLAQAYGLGVRFI